MKLFDIELSKDLVEINKRLQHEKNIDVRNSLLVDRKFILKYLGFNKTMKQFNYKRLLDKSDVIDFLNNNQLNSFRLKKFKILYINHKKMSLLTKIFIEKPENKLYNTYKRIVNYGGLKFFDTPRPYLGVTTYIKSLGKNYIEIYKQNLISDYSTKIHELGHARANNICNTSELKFIESYPVFLELIFSDFLKKNGFVKESYNIKLSLLNQVKNFLMELQDELYSYLSRGEEHCFDNWIFEYKYKILRDIILGFYLYEMYLSNSQETSIKIDYFILNSSKMTEEQLLNILGINIFDFNNSKKLLQKIYNQLEDERELIMKK